MTTQYEHLSGTPADPELQHEARTKRRIDTDGTLHMMSEIGDGVFVQWGDCSSCNKRVATCTCGAGPKEPEYIKKWRTSRFEKSFAERGLESRATPRAVRGLLEDAQAAQDAAYKDSNDDEIELLRGALESALELLGLKMPEGVDPDAAPEEPDEHDPLKHSVHGQDDYSEACPACRQQGQVEVTALEATLGIKPEPLVDDALAAGLERVKAEQGNSNVGF